MRIVESGNAKFIENGQISGSGESRKVDIQEIQVESPPPNISTKIVVPFVVSQSHYISEQQFNKPNP